MSYKQCPFCGEKNIQRGYGTGVDLMTQDNRPWIGCPNCQYWIRGNSCVKQWNTRFYEKENAELQAQLARYKEALDLWNNHISICNGVDEDDDEGFVAMMESRSRAIDAMNIARAAKDTTREEFKVDSAQQSVVNSYHTYRLY